MNQKCNDLLLIKSAQEGDEESFNEVFASNQLLIYSLLKKYHIQKNEYEDVKSCANIGLIQAINKFDFSYNVSFSTYAVPLILGEIKKYFKENSLLKVSRGNKERYLKIIKAKEELEKELFRSPCLKEIASFIDEPIEEVISSLEANTTLTYLDESVSQDEDLSLMNIVGDPSFSLDKIEINLALEKLNKKERLFIDLRFYQGLSQVEIAKRLFISQVQVSRIETKILEKLKSIV